MNEPKIHTVDPVANLLIEKLHFTPVTLAIVWTVIVIILNSIAALASDSFFSSATQMGLTNDWIWWVWTLVFTPVLTGYYLWSADSMRGIIRGLRQSNILKIEEADVNAVMKYFGNPWRQYWSFAFMLIIGVLVYVSRREFSGFAGSSIATKLVVSFTYAILSYFTAILISNLFANVWSIRRIMRDKTLNINPLHPDRCGGLRVLSDYSIKVVYLNAVFGILISITGYRLITQGYVWAAIICVVLYICIATISFFSPLGTAHEGMREAKTTLLMKLGRQFWADYLVAQNAVSGDIESLRNVVAKIKDIRELYDFTNAFPVWPFDSATLRRFFITITSPLVPALIGLLIDLLKKIYQLD